MHKTFFEVACDLNHLWSMCSSKNWLQPESECPYLNHVKLVQIRDTHCRTLFLDGAFSITNNNDIINNNNNNKEEVDIYLHEILTWSLMMDDKNRLRRETS